MAFADLDDFLVVLKRNLTKKGENRLDHLLYTTGAKSSLFDPNYATAKVGGGGGSSGGGGAGFLSKSLPPI